MPIVLESIHEVVKSSFEKTEEKTIFPVKKLSYYTEKVADETFDKLKSIVDDLKIDVLKKSVSNDTFEIIQKTALKSDSSVESVCLLLEVLRARIVEDDARSFIHPDQLVEFVNSLTDKESSEPFVLNFLHVIVNIFINYTGEILDDVNVLEILSSFAPRFSDFNPNTQTVYATLAFNYSTLLGFEIEKCETMVGIVCSVVSPALNQLTLLRLLYACGNVAFFWDEAKEKLKEHCENINNLKSANIPNECKIAIPNIMKMMKL